MSQYDRTRQFVRISLSNGVFPTPTLVCTEIYHRPCRNLNDTISRARIDELYAQGWRKGKSGFWFKPCEAPDALGDHVFRTCALRLLHSGPHRDKEGVEW